MRCHFIRTLLVLSFTVLAAPLSTATAADTPTRVHFEKQAPFSEVFGDLRDAIVNRGLVIDFVGNVDNMLERTSAVAGSVTETGSATPYLHAKYVIFCAAKLTHQSVSANPFNIEVCPYVVFAFETRAKPGHVIVGYRRPVPGPSKLTKAAYARIEELLTAISKEATGN